MKRTISTLMAAAAAAALVGCVVTSVSPFYTEKDLVFEPGLVGNWLKQVNDSTPEVWKFEKSGKAYRFTLIEERKATVMEAHAFKLQGQLFLDVFSLEQDIHVIPPHYLLKVTELTTTSLQVAELDNGWLKKLLADNPQAIAHHLVGGDKSEDLRVVLTADTAALQEFILAHMETDEAWKNSFDLNRE